MFIRYYVEVSHQSENVPEALLRRPNEWLAGAAQDSLRSGRALSAAVGLNLGHHRVERRVDVQLGPPMALGHATVVPVQWRDRAHPSLFPRLEADLEIAAMGAHRTQLAINVRYEPPLGIIGAVADRALMHRVAEATIKDFTDQVATRLHELIVMRAHWVKLQAAPAASLSGALI